MPSQKEKLVAVIAHRIADMNGFYRPSQVRKYHNPGALPSWGKLPVIDALAVFPNERKGWDALKRIIDLQVQRRVTFFELFSTAGQLPATDNPQAWAEWVASPFKCSVHTVIWSLIEGKPVTRGGEGEERVGIGGGVEGFTSSPNAPARVPA